MNLLRINHLSLVVPFDEDDRDDSVWFLDHDYLENMYGMFKKVNGKSSHLGLFLRCNIFYLLKRLLDRLDRLLFNNSGSPFQVFNYMS